MAYFEQLPPIKLSNLYDSPYTCQAVMRSLPPLAKQYVVRLLFLDAGIPEGQQFLAVVFRIRVTQEAGLAGLARYLAPCGATSQPTVCLSALPTRLQG